MFYLVEQHLHLYVLRRSAKSHVKTKFTKMYEAKPKRDIQGIKYPRQPSPDPIQYGRPPLRACPVAKPSDSLGV